MRYSLTLIILLAGTLVGACVGQQPKQRPVWDPTQGEVEGIREMVTEMEKCEVRLSDGIIIMDPLLDQETLTRRLLESGGWFGDKAKSGYTAPTMEEFARISKPCYIKVARAYLEDARAALKKHDREMWEVSLELFARYGWRGGAEWEQYHLTDEEWKVVEAAVKEEKAQEERELHPPPPIPLPSPSPRPQPTPARIADATDV